MIRVVLVEDHAVVRRGLRALIDSSEDMQVVGEAGSGVEGLAVVAETRPDVVLVDVQLPAMDGITATEVMLGASDPGPRVVVLTAFGDEETVFRALRAGASAFLLKDSPPEVVLDAIRTVMRGDALVGAEVTRMLIARALSASPAAPATAAGPSPPPLPSSPSSLPDELTPREVEVLALVGAGLSNAEISARLVISPATTKTHIRHLLAKTGARNRAQLVVLAHQSGLVPRST